MAIIKWTPMWDPFEEMNSALDKWPGAGLAQTFVPSMDVYQTDNEVVAEMPLPGIDPENVEVSIENDVLTIEGRSEQKSEVDEKNYYRKEIRSGAFHRSVALPVSVNGDQAKAVYEDGVLKISVPKEERIKPKTVKIDIKKKNK